MKMINWLKLILGLLTHFETTKNVKYECIVAKDVVLRK